MRTETYKCVRHAISEFGELLIECHITQQQAEKFIAKKFASWPDGNDVVDGIWDGLDDCYEKHEEE